MFCPNSLIQEFMIPVPICRLTTCATDLWSHLSGRELAGSDRLVVVNQEELPIGVIYLHSVIPYFNSDEQFFPTQDSLILPQPESAIVRAVMQPLKILPGDLSVKEFWTNLQQLQNRHVETQDWAVVNSEGK